MSSLLKNISIALAFLSLMTFVIAPAAFAQDDVTDPATTTETTDDTATTDEATADEAEAEAPEFANPAQAAKAEALAEAAAAVSAEANAEAVEAAEASVAEAEAAVETNLERQPNLRVCRLSQANHRVWHGFVNTGFVRLRFQAK